MEKFDFKPQPENILKKRKRNEDPLKSKHHKGMKLLIRKKIIDLFKEGKSPIEVNKLYPKLKIRYLYNMKNNPLKYSLPENDIKQIS